MADADQENPTKRAQIQQIGAFELVAFGSCCSEFRHRKGIVRFLHFSDSQVRLGKGLACRRSRIASQPHSGKVSEAKHPRV